MNAEVVVVGADELAGHTPASDITPLRPAAPPRPPVIAVRDGAARVLVRRETEDDLLALDAG